MKALSARCLIVAIAACLGACGIFETEPDVPEEVEEIGHGLVEGYLDVERQLDSRVFVPPAPSEDSARQALDDAVSVNTEALRGTDRWQLAILDADLSFPAAAGTFSCALGIPVSEEGTPWLYMLLRRTLTDIGLAPYAAKNAYNRERPFMVKGDHTCTPDEEELLRGDGSYPSGHTAVGWGWSLILSELAPDRAEEILDRGRAFGENRNVCNAHWYSDVVAGRLAGAAAVARLHTSDEFLYVMSRARAEIDLAQSQGLAPDRDCPAEAEALSVTYYD
jgi:acid phosphatase (class A)